MAKPDVERREQFKRLHSQGLRHHEIVERMGVQFPTLWRWSRAMNLTRNPLWDEEDARRHYDAGFTDPEIAKRVGCQPLTIMKWRRRLGLPANYRRREPARQADLDKQI